MNLDKYFRVYAKIKLDIIYNNIKKIKNNVDKDTLISAVIKTDGYGHGAVPIALFCKDIVDYFAVATIDEALNLRKHGIQTPVLVIGYSHFSRNNDAVKNDIRLTVYNYEMAELISKAATAEKKAAKIHIKIDTGMNRIGFKINEKNIEKTINDIEQIYKLPFIEIEGIFTHFFSSDSQDKKFAENQAEKFTEIINILESKNIFIPIKHCSNSAAAMEMKSANLNMVRAGIAIYGLWPSDEVDKNSVFIEPALELKSHIINIKEIEKGETVSYGATFKAERPTIVATIPVGYGDGYQRNLTNKGSVIIKGKRASVIGRICMDQFMVDITDLNDVKTGDEVTLIGKEGNEIITVEELGNLSGIFNYEFVCDLGKRIPRIYYNNEDIMGTKDYFDDEYFTF